MDKKEIIDKYRYVKHKIGKTPTRLDMQNNGVSKRQINNFFNSYTDFLIEMGDKKHKFKPKKKNCASCGKEFNTSSNNPSQRFCSRSCSNKHTKLVHGIYCKNKLCAYCGESHDRGSDFCSTPCRMLNDMSKQSIKDSSKRHGGANAYDSIRSRARNLSKYFYPPECKICKYSKHYEVCHIKPIKDFNENTLISEVNNPNNLVHLCPNCHWEFDNDLVFL